MKNILVLTQFYIYRLWPVFSMIVFLFFLFVVSKIFPSRRHTIWTISGIAMIILGGYMQLVILNQNMSILNDTSLLSQITQFSRSVTVTIPNGVGGNAEGGYITARAKNQQAKTIKEKIKILELDLDHAEREIAHSREFVLSKIYENRLEFDSKLNDLNARVNGIKSLLGNTVVGDYRIQFFSILITILGSVILVIPALTKIPNRNL